MPKDVPLFITESNQGLPGSAGGLWLRNCIGTFLAGGGGAAYCFHDLPAPLRTGHKASPGTFYFFSAGPT